MIDHINATRPVHVLTIEDPIEFLYSNKIAQVSQREVGPDTRSFTTALRAALRQDPDVILVGEMRDPETIDIALKAAETGHMVFSTVHTTDAAKTIGRLIGVFPPEEQQNVRLRLADNLRGVISQRLLPRSDGKGRVVAAEILIATPTVQDHIRDSRDHGSLEDLIERGGDQYGMQTFDQHLHELHAAGAITIDVAKSAATSPDNFQQQLDYGQRSSYTDDLHSELEKDVWDPTAS
jgi:twitching motility protein PilT